MGIFDKIFGSVEPSVWPDHVRFGRYTDAYKSEEKYDAWDASMDLFEQGQYDEAFRLFFVYLADESQQNVRSWMEDQHLHFELLQGSKMLSGRISDRFVTAEARIARTNGLSIGMLRKMMELNFKLKYSRYALDPEDHLTLVFDSHLLDCSPYKLYYALKEIAVSADKQDDLLIRDFKSLEPVNTGHILPIPDQHKSVKAAFIRRKVAQAFTEIDRGRLNPDRYAGAFGYVLLDLAYRLDYLVKPEGALTEHFEKVHRIYFETNNGESLTGKNLEVRKIFEEVADMSDADIHAELYNIPATFGITSPGNHEQLAALIDSEIYNMDWYVENRHHAVALAFPGYIAGYALFNYAFPPPDKDLLHLYYHIVEPEYFLDIGFERAYLDPGTGKLHKREIMGALEEWRDVHRRKFPRLEVSSKHLSFDSLPAFARSYFLFIRGLDMTKAP